MALNSIIKSKAEDLGKTNEMKCPQCGKDVKFRVFSCYDLNNYVALLLKKDKETNFAVCPECASVFLIEMSAYGIQNSVLHDYNLTLLHDNSKS